MCAVTYLITFSLISILSVSARRHKHSEPKVEHDPTFCLNNNEKKILNKFKVSQEIIPLLQGKTFTDIWRRTDSAKFVDCSLTEFKLEDNKLKVEMLRQDHETVRPTKYIYHETWTERKGEGQFEVTGEEELPYSTIPHTQLLQFFYADENAFGVFSCGLYDLKRLVVAVRKDKQGDEATEESLKKAEKILDQVKSVISDDEMVKLTQQKCPEKV